MVALSFLFGCGSRPPAALGLDDGRLAPCPDRPNCVASDAADADHRTEPLRFQGDPAGVWDGLKAVLAELPRTRIIVSDDRYLHAEARSRVFGFVDDLEFLLRPEDRLIAVRSAARVGYGDFGVNADRIETIRVALTAKGLVAP